MTIRMRVALAVGFILAITAFAVSAMAFTGSNSSATPVKVRSPAASADQVRVERRESFKRTGCKHARQYTPDV
jgi:hypothetical protein